MLEDAASIAENVSLARADLRLSSGLGAVLGCFVGFVSARNKYVHTQFSLMTNITLSVPEDLYRKMKRRRDVKWSEVARQAIAERLEQLEGPVGFYASASELANMIARAGVRLDEVSVAEAIRHYRKMRELEWQRTSTIQAN
jgi:hypothetical protein